ncbi:MAG TPA: hypothetical protein VFA43_00595 [Gemmatimonadaceae bacterium]|nr:hypothetical protein [Gemmatimonadaceae bacterium]
MLGTRVPPGPGLLGDAAGYLGSAESLVHHGNLRVPFAPYVSADSTSPLDHWPPGFPIAIAAPLRAGFSPITSARLVVATSAAITCAVIVLLLGSNAGLAWGLAAAGAVGITASVVSVHLDVVSEPPFITAVVATLALMAMRPNRPVLYGLTAAVSLLMRYLGLAIVSAAAFWALMQPASSTWERIRRAVLAALPGIIVWVAWTLFMRAHGTEARQVHIDPTPLDSARQLVGATLSWLAPDTVGSGLTNFRALRIMLKAALTFGVIYVLARQWRGEPNATRRTIWASLLLVAALLGMLAAADYFNRASTFYDRVFSPVHALLDLAIVAALALWWRTTRRHAIAIAAVVAWVVASGKATADVVHVGRTVGFYHSTRENVDAPLWRWVRDSTPTRPEALFTNDNADVYFMSHRPSRGLPLVFDADTARALAAALGRQPALIVWSAGYTESVLFPELLPQATTVQKLEATLPLRRIAVFPQGIVWKYDPALDTLRGSH